MRLIAKGIESPRLKATPVFLANVKELNSITEDWWIEYSLPMCAYTERQLSLLEDKFACPCQIHKGNGMTLDTKMNAIPCNMFFDLSLGKFNKDFTSLDSYQHMIQTRLQQEGGFLEVKQMPSLNCKTCQYWERCMGGCPVTWKNYSFDALMKFKATYYRSSCPKLNASSESNCKSNQ